MTREEELVRIAKKLDKMVSRNNTVRLYFDTHRWRVVLRTRPLRASVATVDFTRRNPLDFCSFPLYVWPPVRRSRPRTNKRSTVVRAGVALCPGMQFVHLLTVSRLVRASTSEQRDGKSKQRGLCARSRRPAAAKTCPQSGMRDFWPCCCRING